MEYQWKRRRGALQIVRKRRERHGFQGWQNRALAWVLSPFFRCRCRIPEHLAILEEPVVFVSNHYEIFGPLAMVVSLPLKFRFWSNSIILEPTKHIEKMAPDARRAMPLLPLGVIRWMLTWLTPVWEKAIRCLEPIPVYKQDVGLQRASIRRSVDCMLRGDHIVLFPETAVPYYSNGSVTPFHRSFALIGEYYRRATGKQAAFVPVYVDRWRRRITFGEVVRYGDGDPVTVCGQVCDEVRGRILAMAEAAHPGITRTEDGACE